MRMCVHLYMCVCVVLLQRSELFGHIVEVAVTQIVVCMQSTVALYQGHPNPQNCSAHWCRGTIGNNDVPIYTLEPFLFVYLTCFYWSGVKRRQEDIIQTWIEREVTMETQRR